MKTMNVTTQMGKILEEKGFGSDANNETDITKAGMFDLLDALSGKDNTKFSVEAAQNELAARGV